MPFFNPSLDDMQKEVLSWDFHSILKRDTVHTLTPVPNQFASTDAYLDVFEPLLLEECRAQVLRGVREQHEFTKPHHLRLMSVETRGQFLVITFEAPPEPADPTKGTRYFDTDLVFVSYDEMKNLDEDQPPQRFHALALVQLSSPGLLSLKFYLPELAPPHLLPKTHRRLVQLRKVMTPSTMWWVHKLDNLVTINREYQALHSTPELPLTSCLLDPSQPVEACRSLHVPPTLLAAIKQRFNQSQQEAMLASLKGFGVTLIQGPPGTGKTNTILGLLSVLLNSKAEKEGSTDSSRISRATLTNKNTELPSCPTSKQAEFSVAAPWLSPGYQPPKIDPLLREENCFPKADETDTWMHLNKLNTVSPPQHVLVCAPSNAAIDEIVRRLREGLIDAHGNTYHPSLVRVGPNIHMDLLDVSLDTLAKKRHSESLADNPNNTYDAAKMAVLNDASIVCTTLSCAGYSMFSQLDRGFDTVLVDEAAQAVEVSTLIPLKYGCQRVILVGDPNQLPATLFSPTAVANKYDLSLFERLMACNHPVHMLSTQYRMHPDISYFPAKTFYDGILTDGAALVPVEGNPGVCHRAFHKFRCFGPYVFYDSPDSTAEQNSKGSWYNHIEAQIVLCIFRALVDRFPDDFPNCGKDIGIVTPYNGQVKYIKELFKENFGADVTKGIDISTVDGFQGREKNVVIMSCVRAMTEEWYGGVGLVVGRRNHKNRRINFLF